MFVHPSVVVPNKNSTLLGAGGITLFVPYIIKVLSNGQKLGICGVTTKDKVETGSFPDKGTTVRFEIEATTECVQQLTALGINKIVLLTHVGIANDIRLLAQIPNVDVIVGGDSHTLLGGSLLTSAGFAPQGPYATITSNGVCIVQAFEYAKVVGRLDVAFDSAGVVTSCTGALEAPLNTEGYEVRDARPIVFLGRMTRPFSPRRSWRGVCLQRRRPMRPLWPSLPSSRTPSRPFPSA